MPISEMNHFIEKLTLAELFDMLEVDRYRRLPEYRKHLTEVELADLRLTRHRVEMKYLAREAFEGNEYVSELARLLIYIVKTCQLSGITAEEYHRHHLNLILSQLDHYPDDICSAAKIYERERSIEPPAMWYFDLVSDRGIVNSIAGSIAAIALSAALSSLMELITAGGDSAEYFIELLKYLGIAGCACELQISPILREAVSIVNQQRQEEARS